MYQRILNSLQDFFGISRKRGARCTCDDAILRNGHLDALFFPALDFAFSADGQLAARAEGAGQHCAIIGKTAGFSPVSRKTAVARVRDDASTGGNQTGSF